MVICLLDKKQKEERARLRFVCRAANKPKMNGHVQWTYLHVRKLTNGELALVASNQHQMHWSLVCNFPSLKGLIKKEGSFIIAKNTGSEFIAVEKKEVTFVFPDINKVIPAEEELIKSYTSIPATFNVVNMGVKTLIKLSKKNVFINPRYYESAMKDSYGTGKLFFKPEMTVDGSTTYFPVVVDHFLGRAMIMPVRDTPEGMW